MLKKQLNITSQVTAIFQGDAVQIASNSGVLTQAGTGTTNVGVFWGCNYDDSTGKPAFRNQSAAGQASVGFVYDDPYQVFEIQGDQEQTLHRQT